MTSSHAVRVSYHVPYTCQFATPDLVADFLFDGCPLQTDPNWAASGANSPDEYAHWAMRSCGVVAVKMVVEGLGGPVRSVMDWVQAGLALDGYLTQLREERPVEVGWKHSVLAGLAQAYGLHAELLADVDLAAVAELIRADRCFLASVSSEVGEGTEADTPITRRNGHIVVVHGLVYDDDAALTHLLLHNSSGRTPALRADARLPVARFAQAFSGRGIAIGP